MKIVLKITRVEGKIHLDCIFGVRLSKCHSSVFYMKIQIKLSSIVYLYGSYLVHSLGITGCKYKSTYILSRLLNGPQSHTANKCAYYTNIFHCVWLPHVSAGRHRLGTRNQIASLQFRRDTNKTQKTNRPIRTQQHTHKTTQSPGTVQTSKTERTGWLRIWCINLLKTKRNLLYIRNQSVPRSKLSTTITKTSQLMMYKSKVAVCSEIRTKHLAQSERHVERWMLNLVVRKETARL